MRIFFSFLILSTVLFQATGQSKTHYPKGAFLVKVQFKEGGGETGIWIDCDETSITISDLNDLNLKKSWPAEEIYRLEFRRVRSVKRNALIGAGVGFVVGFAIEWDELETPMGPDIHQLGHAAGVGLLGAFCGGFVGYFTGFITKSYYIFGSMDQYQKIKPELMKYKLPVVD